MSTAMVIVISLKGDWKPGNYTCFDIDVLYSLFSEVKESWIYVHNKGTDQNTKRRQESAKARVCCFLLNAVGGHD
jgi:hypothetical protein